LKNEVAAAVNLAEPDNVTTTGFAAFAGFLM
jgi:hypothetical protein